jgi:hypothetical protein
MERAKECEERWGTAMAGVAAGCWAGNRVCSEGLSCIFVGPIETAEKAHLEALYEQARDSYYSGQPLIGDAMFDKVEVRTSDLLFLQHEFLHIKKLRESGGNSWVCF